MKKISLIVTGLLLLSIGNISCLGIKHGKAKGMAFIEISDTTAEKVSAAAKKVFLDDAYELMQEQTGQLVFEKPGSRMQDLSYGALSEDGVWVKAVLTIQEKSGGTCWVSCDAYMVKNRNDDFFREETEVLRAFGHEYQRMLRQVKRTARQ